MLGSVMRIRSELGFEYSLVRIGIEKMGIIAGHIENGCLGVEMCSILNDLRRGYERGGQPWYVIHVHEH